jgi:mannitol/fructose-specific phosphotransferase system IIA component (Ntr-type)
LVNIARELGVPAPTLIEIARRVSPLLTEYVEHVPEAGSVFAEIALRGLDADQLAEVHAFVEARFPARDRKTAWRSVRELLSEDRTILGLRCGSVTDALQLAATRLAPGSGYDAAELAHALNEKERAQSSGIGAGVAVTGMTLPRAPEAGVIVVFGAALEHPTPDGQPLNVLVVLLGPKGESHFSPYVAEIARLTDRGLVPALTTASTGAEALAAFDMLRRLT